MLTGQGRSARSRGLLFFQAMSEEQVKAFLEAVKADEALQEEVNGAGDYAAAVVAIAKAAGFVISAEELARAQAEVSEDELVSVAGGSTSSLGVVLGLACGNSPLLAMNNFQPKSS